MKTIRKYQMLKRALGGKALFFSWGSLSPKRERTLSFKFSMGSFFSINMPVIFYNLIPGTFMAFIFLLYTHTQRRWRTSLGLAGINTAPIHEKGVTHAA